ncbi:MAG: hypothetical protein JWM59_2377 [Verrucomicrobiales bacterium]|nr:hypothetical protein [Verrucomicrobiales bacterium]
MKNTTPKLLDCTIRDGGYLNDWDFTLPFVYRLLRVLDESGFDFAEVGFWNPKDAGTLWKHCDIETLKALDAGSLRIKLVLLLDYGTCCVDEVPAELAEYVSLIRVTAHKKTLTQAADFAFALRQKGFSVTVNAMGITSYSKADLVHLATEAHRAQGRCDYFYLADSFGALTPEETARVFHLLSTVSEVPLGFHPHNNLELAVANTLTAVESGASIIDSSLLGIGRGGGNLRSEVIAAILARKDRSKVNPLPLLSFADATFDRIGARLGLSYDLEQVISGMAGCHPNYASALIGPRRLALDEIFHVIEAIPCERKNQFSDALLEEMITAAAAKAEPVAGEPPSTLACAGSASAVLLCPGAVPPQIPAGVPIFSVNTIPSGIELTGAIFGSLRRLWQNGDTAGKVPVWLAWNRHTQRSLPSCRVLDAASMEAKTGISIQNSGIRALALLLEAGYRTVEVYGMKGFSVPGTSGDGTGDGILKHLNDEAVVELKAVAAAYATTGASFILHESPLSKVL